jgi:hypothetical protein
MLVGTFHKSGTVLMLNILRAVAREFGLRVALPASQIAPDAWQIFFHPHSLFTPETMAVPHRGVVVIRDPRDVIISGAHYHCKSDATRDGWLYQAQSSFGGLSYHQAILSQPTEEARLTFEMRHFGRRTLTAMSTWVSPPETFIRVRFEDLVVDRELREFRRMFDWLGFDKAQTVRALAIAEGQSLFSGKVSDVHVRSGRPAQWREHFTPDLHRHFRSLFGDLPERLGYPAA